MSELETRSQYYKDRRNRLWLTYAPLQDKLAEYEMLANDPPRRRERVTAIVGDSNTGKTALIKEFLRRHPSVRVDGNLVVPAIHLVMTEYMRVEEVSIDLLGALAVPDATSHTHADRMKRFYAIAPRMGLKLVFLDEFHDCADTAGRGGPFVRLLKGLLLKGVRAIPAGTEELADLLAQNRQLHSRINFHRGVMPLVTDPQLIRTCMEQIADFPSHRITDAAVAFVQQSSRGRIGQILDLIEDTLVYHGDLRCESLETVARLL